MASVHSPADEDVVPEDSASQTRSVCSSSAVKLKAAVKRATLSARAKVMKDLQELELQELQCKQQRENLELKMQLAEADAEEQVCQEFGEKLVVESGLNPEAAEWVTTGGSNPAAIKETPVFQSVNDEVQFRMPHSGEVAAANKASSPADHDGIAHLISHGQHQQQQMLEALQMPHAELCAYDGDPLKYWMFITAFENNVGCLSVDDSKKLTRLLYYCRGKALRVIQCCASMEPRIGYAKARKLLEERFGNRYIVTEAWLAKVTEGPILGNWDSDGLQEFADNLRCCKETLEAMGNSHEIDGQRVLVKVVERLPAYLQVRWRKGVEISVGRRAECQILASL